MLCPELGRPPFSLSRPQEAPEAVASSVGSIETWCRPDRMVWEMWGAGTPGVRHSRLSISTLKGRTESAPPRPGSAGQDLGLSIKTIARTTGNSEGAWPTGAWLQCAERREQQGRGRPGAWSSRGRVSDALRRAIPEAVSVLGSRRRAAGGRDLLFFVESERGVRSAEAEAEAATAGSSRAEARVECACPRGAAAPGPARDPGE